MPPERLIDRLRKRMARGEALSGRIHLSAATPDGLAAVARLLGRRPARGRTLTVDWDQLAEILLRDRACDAGVEKALPSCE